MKLVHTFNVLHMQNLGKLHSGVVVRCSLIRFVALVGIYTLLFIGFAIKLPAVPFHTWLPDAHVEAPTAISVILAALASKDWWVWNSPICLSGIS
jgi:NADH-quinone oxidoreductase subunit M